MGNGTPLRLLVTGFSWPPTTFIERLFDGLHRAGLDLTFATHQRPGGAWLKRPRVSWVSLRHLRPLKLLHLATGGRLAGARLRADLGFLRARLPRERRKRWFEWRVHLPLAGRRWDAVYFPWNSGAIQWLPLFSLHRPTVLSCRGSQVNNAPHDPRRTDFREALSETLRLATAVHCVSGAILQEARRYGLDADRAHVIHPAVDPETFRPAAVPRAPDGAFRVITAGSLTWRKGYEAALVTVRHLLDRGVPAHFEIIGTGPDRRRLEYTVGDLGIGEHVTLHGRLTPAEVVGRLQAADAFLLSSVTEGISNAVLESMACALPVVTTDCGGMREAVTDGVEGFCVPIGDATAAAVALERLYRDVDLRRRLGAAGRRRVQDEFNMEDQIRAFVTLFEQVARGERGQADGEPGSPGSD